MNAWCIRYLSVPLPGRKDKVLEKSWPVTQAFWKSFFEAIPPEIQHLRSNLLFAAQVGLLLISAMHEVGFPDDEELSRLCGRLEWFDRYE